MTTKLIALASALTASMLLASAAEAGGGVRVGFGFPLGSFTATPAHGGGGGAGYQKQAKKRPPVQQAARPEKSTPRVAKAEPVKAEASKSEPAKNDTASDDSAPRITGSSALIQGSIPVEEEAVTPAADVKAEAPATDSTVTASTEQAPDASGSCKKFIPAIGMTVSVGCGE